MLGKSSTESFTGDYELLVEPVKPGEDAVLLRAALERIDQLEQQVAILS